MILVTGTKRSGTSMWMQIFGNAGFQLFGKDFLGKWKTTILEANKKGFFESPLRKGINYKTNPNPKTGGYLHPHKTEKDVVKVFVPGLIQTDYAFIHRVIGTIRPWNEFSSSMERLLEMEFNSHLSGDNSDLIVRIRSIINRPSLHWAHIWWTDNFDLIHDALLKKYPINIVSYGRLLREPDILIPSILNWCQSPLPSDVNLYKRKLSIDMEKAIATVDTSLQTQTSPQIDDHDLPAEFIKVFDNFYDCFNHNNSEISPSIVKDLNMVQEKIVDYRTKQIKKYILKKNKELIELGIKQEQARTILKNTKLFLNNDDKLRKLLKI